MTRSPGVILSEPRRSEAEPVEARNDIRTTFVPSTHGSFARPPGLAAAKPRCGIGAKSASRRSCPKGSIAGPGGRLQDDLAATCRVHRPHYGNPPVYGESRKQPQTLRGGYVDERRRSSAGIRRGTGGYARHGGSPEGRARSFRAEMALASRAESADVSDSQAALTG